MTPVNRVVMYLLVASILGLSACVVGPQRGYGHDRQQSGARSDHDDARHDDPDHRCSPNDDHHGEDCRAPDHH
jgi:hypothetical protein